MGDLIESWHKQNHLMLADALLRVQLKKVIVYGQSHARLPTEQASEHFDSLLNFLCRPFDVEEDEP